MNRPRPRVPRPRMPHPRLSVPRPPGPFRPDFWRSPLRGTWLTSFLGSMPARPGRAGGAHRPDLARHLPAAARPQRHRPPGGDIGPLIPLPASSPAWLYALTQGAHITIGLVAIPLLLAKLWSVIPRLFAWPPVGSPAQALERLSVLLLVGGALFEFATGVLNIQVFYPWGFSFVSAHYYGAWVFIAALILHVAVKLPTVRRAYREHGVLKPLKQNLAYTRAEPYESGGLAPRSPASPTISRRGLLAMVGGTSLALLVANLGESVGGPLRRIALLAPRGRVFGTGPNDFQINKTADAVNVTRLASDPRWRLVIQGKRKRRLTRADLLAMPQHTYELPIACVEGWSTTQHWTGVRLADLADLVGASSGAVLEVESLQPAGSYRQTAFTSGQVRDPRALVALRVGGVDLSLDHGYPARIMVPAVPGVHLTKWLASMRFLEE